MSFTNERLTVLYGSQTGNSQDISERIQRESKRCYFSCTVKSMDDFKITNLFDEIEKCIIFVCSTTGQGEEPDNMKTFWKFLLRKNLPPDCLSTLKFAVLGLGDSSYTKFNFAAKRLHKRLLQLGGEAVIPLGLGDDQHDLGYDAVVDPWIESLWSNLLMVYPLPQGISPLNKNLTILPRFHVSSDLPNLSKINKTQSIYYYTRKSSDFTVTVVENKRITHPEHFQDVRLLKLKTDGQEYSPGDVISLRPRNLPWQIEDFQNVLKTNGLTDITPNTVLRLTENDPEIPLPDVLKVQVTFQQLCEEYFDLMAIPRRYTFEVLAQITDSDLEKEKCVEFTTAEGQEDLYTYCNRPRRNIVEVLRDFPHATKNLTMDMLFEILPPIKPRDFSIASSFKTHKDEIHILLAVVKYKTKLVKERYGLCSNYLADLESGHKLTAWIKKGSLRFPKDKDAAVIMVGPGTGMAPFRNFILDRCEENKASSKNLLLFFGCRGKNLDFHCKDEFLRLVDEKKLNLICAFSRDQEFSKVYVQDKILENKEAVWEALQKPSAHVFVAGNAKLMPQAVRKAFITVCEICGKMPQNEATTFIEKMEKQSRYQTECW